MSDSSKLLLGSIEVTEFIARGGMGAVWAGVDHRVETDVAVKIINSELARDPAIVEAFRGEVRSVARLRHSAIVEVYDYGEVGEEAAERSGGELIAGSPYLVMERIHGPSLRDLDRALDWGELRSMTLQILEALAHTHARDIVHRDLKPGNVLVAEPAESGDWVKVGDFGIAHALDTSGDSWDPELAKGTPGYMPPEQKKNRWRSFGPWTDLFALGRIVEQLVADGEAPLALAGWLARMVAEDPRDRFARAADAAHALRDIEAGRFTSGHAVSALLAAGTQRTLDQQVTATTVVGPGETFIEDVTLRPDLGRAQPVPPFPSDWRPSVQPLAVVGRAGIGLYGLRPVPLVARDRERDALWSHLEKSVGGQPNAVILRGGTGVGKSCLARWLCELAHEIGAAETLRATFGPELHPEHGMGAMLGRYFRCAALPRGEVLERLREQLRAVGLGDPHDWVALAELLAPAPEPSEISVRFADESEQHRVIYRLLCHVSAQRTAIVWLDDVHFNPSSLAFLRQLGTAPWLEQRVLVVATVQEEALGEAAEIIDRLIAEGIATELRVEPLEPADHRMLVRQLLGLEDSLAVRVEALTEGNPLFAEQVVGDLIQRHLLEATSTGQFALRSGAELELPDNLHALWTTRIERIAEGQDLAALELAAILGGEVDDNEWRWACALTGLRPSHDLVQRLVEQRLAESRPSDRHWWFVNNMVRDCLERGARERGRLTRHHQTCAELISSHGGALADERVALHKLAAGDREAAEPLLYSAALRRHQRGEFQAAHRLLAERDAVLESAELDVSDGRRIDGWLLQAKCCRTRGDLDDALRWVERGIAAARALGDRDRVCDGLMVLESVHRLRGHTDRAGEVGAEAMTIAQEIGDVELIADCDRELGWVSFNQGDFDVAVEHFERAVAAHDEPTLQSVLRTTSCLNGIAHAAVQRGDLDGARAALERALELHALVPSSHDAYSFGVLGDIERAAGNLDAAERAQRRALERLRAVGYGHTAYVEMNIGLVYLERRDFREARSWFHRALESLTSQGDVLVLGIPHAMMVPCLAASGEWHELDAHFEIAEAKLTAANLADADVAGPLTLGAELAADAGEVERARRIFAIARDQWSELGREDKVADIDARLATLDSG